MKSVAVLVALVAVAATVTNVVQARKADNIMEEIRSVVGNGIAESKASTGMMVNALRSTERGLQDSTVSKPYPWWALPPLSASSAPPKWSRAGLNNFLNEQISSANDQFQEAYADYERDYCTEPGPIVNSEWAPGRFSGGSCKLKISLGGCYIYPIDGPDPKKAPISLAVNCTTPTISYDATKPRYESPYKTPTEYNFGSCRGKSITLGQEKTNYLQYPGEQFAVPFVRLPAAFPPKLSQWVGLGRFKR